MNKKLVSILKIISFLFFTSILIASQKIKDIYIVFEDFKKIEITTVKNDSIELSLYTLKELKNRVSKKVILNKDGNISTKLVVPTDNNLISEINLQHKNTHKSNPPFIVEANKIENILVYPKDFENVNLQDILKILKNSKSIFIIDSKYPDSYYKAKKVTLDIKPKL